MGDNSSAGVKAGEGDKGRVGNVAGLISGFIHARTSHGTIPYWTFSWNGPFTV